MRLGAYTARWGTGSHRGHFAQTALIPIAGTARVTSECAWSAQTGTTQWGAIVCCVVSLTAPVAPTMCRSAKSVWTPTGCLKIKRVCHVRTRSAKYAQVIAAFAHHARPQPVPPTMVSMHLPPSVCPAARLFAPIV